MRDVAVDEFHFEVTEVFGVGHLVGMLDDEVGIAVWLAHQREFLLKQVDGYNIVDGVRERGDGIQTFDVVLDDRHHGEVAQAASLDELDEGDEFGPWVRSWGIENEVGVVQNLLFASVLDGHEDLSGRLLLLVDLLLRFVEVSFSVFSVSGSWWGEDWFNRLDSDSFFLQDYGLQVVGIHESEGHCVHVPLDGSLLPSLMRSLEGVGCFDLAGFVGSFGESLSIRDFEVGLGLLVQNIQSSHRFDGGIDPFHEREGLTAGSVVLFEVEVSSTNLLWFG